MRITIEPTCDQAGYSPQACSVTVSMEHPHDDLTWRDMFELFARCLKGMGYNARSIDQFMDGDDNNETQV